MDGEMPEIGTAVMGGACEFCTYAKARTALTLDALKPEKSKSTKEFVRQKLL